MDASNLLSTAKDFKDLVLAPAQGFANLTQAAIRIQNFSHQENPEIFETTKKSISTVNNIFSGLNNLFQFLPIAALSTSFTCSVLHTMGASYEQKLAENRVGHLKKLEKLPIFTKKSAELLKNEEATLNKRKYAFYASTAMTALLGVKLLGTNVSYEVANYPHLNWAITGAGLVNTAFFLYFNRDTLSAKVADLSKKIGNSLKSPIE